jgi:hypothetical protein
VNVNSTTWTDAPAGFSGPGRIGMPRYSCPSVVGGTGVVIAPVAAPIQGSGLSVAARLRPIDERGVIQESFFQQAPAVAGAAPLSATTHKFGIDNNGTTLGIHPPGRPQS